MAKRWSDEQKPHMRRTQGTRGQKDSKSTASTTTRGRRCGGHKRDGHCALPGEVSDGAIKLAQPKECDDADGEVSRGHSNRAIDEGPNRLKTASAGFQTLIGQLRRETAMGRRRGTDSREVCSGGYSQPGACAMKQGSTEPPDTWTVRPVVCRAMISPERGAGLRRPKTLYRNSVGTLESHPGKAGHPRKRVLRSRS
jgi:hypothetical protein